MQISGFKRQSIVTTTRLYLKAKKTNYNNNLILKLCLSNASDPTDINKNIFPAKVNGVK